MSVSKHCTIYTHGMFSQLSSWVLSTRVLLSYYQIKGRRINSAFSNSNHLNYRVRKDEHKITSKMNTNKNHYCYRITN